ncbi:vWA domain-containing protein [Insolitispirillum peregrinum]|uniref:VWA domain containing CoxE-like protein n=1 Tax=Insolitispirillum peregrinum TaxID=80876 RepID=A0A1N7LTL9_9PROT|nr:VWA domain-containing protein [Insolitispirillum peregrinum]SIS77180.1 hypothetical protein SAMN05421779_103548 [Insolitispirillum peregrinum]
MFTSLFYQLKAASVPVSLNEYLVLLEAVQAGCASYRVEDFYYLARATLVKDERNLDKFDRVFARVFEGVSSLAADDLAEKADIPEEWLRKLAEKFLTDEEKAQIASLGGWDALMETLKKRLEEQKDRHQGGNKWIGTAGTSPFGAYGYNPEGIRIGQHQSRHRRAVKVWDKREFRDLDDQVELGTRSLKVALRRLRRFARQGADTELDLDGTIRETARQGGLLDLQLRPERHNTVKVLLFLDVGGSMDDHIQMCEELFSACRSEFKHLEYFYFHNCVYESVWRDNGRRFSDRIGMQDVLRTYPADYKLIFVGDASMSPYELTYPGGSVEHWNEEPGKLWLERMLTVWPHAVWLNPVDKRTWSYTHSLAMVREIMENRMYPLTLEGIDEAIQALSR